MRPKSMILILIALGCGLIASIGISQVVERRSGNETAPVETVPIYVSLADIGIGEELNAQNVKLEDWPVDRIPEGALRDASELEGKSPRQRLYVGEPIIHAKLADTSAIQGPSVRIKPGHRVMSIKVDARSAVSNLVRPGDYVDVLVFLRGGSGFPARTATILSNIEVFSINETITRLTDDEGNSMQARTVSLQVVPKQAETLHHFSSLGVLSLSLRSPDDEKPSVDITELASLFPSKKAPEVMTAMPTPAPVAPQPVRKDEFRMKVILGDGNMRVFAWDKNDPDAVPQEVTAQGPRQAADDDPFPPFGQPQDAAVDEGPAATDDTGQDGSRNSKPQSDD